MEEESWKRNPGRGTLDEESWRRKPGGGILGEESWKRNPGRNPGGGPWEAFWEASERLLGASVGHGSSRGILEQKCAKTIVFYSI